MRPDGDVLQKTDSVRADVLALLREKRYEEALSVLYRARSESPADRQLQKSIDQIKEFLIGAYAKRLGGLDQVATPVPLAVVRSPDALLLSRYIDGSATLGDVAQMCPLGQLRTLQVLIGLYFGAEPPRIDAELARIDVDPQRADSGAPRSGLRVPDAPAAPITLLGGVPPQDDRAPDTARSASSAAVAQRVAQSATIPPAPSSSARRQQDPYEEMFTAGTAAFVQRRYSEAVEAFEACVRLRPDDRAATVMLRRSLQGLESL
jgi:hypothetical protein